MRLDEIAAKDVARKLADLKPPIEAYVSTGPGPRFLIIKEPNQYRKYPVKSDGELKDQETYALWFLKHPH